MCNICFVFGGGGPYMFFLACCCCSSCIFGWPVGMRCFVCFPVFCLFIVACSENVGFVITVCMLEY
jgi:hypothetical protein